MSRSRNRLLGSLTTGLLVLLVLLDLLYSASQHYRQPLDGDLANIVVPAATYAPVLHDPLGLGVLLHRQVYVGPNRFFAHASLYAYLRAMPGWLQRLGLASPIDSVYLACALFKTALQALLLGLLAAYAGRVSGLGSSWRGRPFWLAATLLTPLFQTAGYQGQMGIIDHSITYTFFYAFPLAGLLVLLWPFFRAWTTSHPVKLTAWRLVLLLGLVVYLSFHGPLIAGVVGVLLLLGLLAGLNHYWWKLALRPGPLALLKRLPQSVWLVSGLLALLSAYSLYLGRYHSENFGPHIVPLLQRYQLLPRGIWEELTSKLGLPLLLLAVLTNAWLLARRVPPTPTSGRLLGLARGLGWFSAAYLLLLPLGGYRPYRELILRYDTLLPITLGLLLAYAAPALYLLRTLPRSGQRWYGAGLAVFSIILLLADKPLKPAASNSYERAALAQLAAAPGPVVQLPTGGTMLSWEPITDYHFSETNALLLRHWGITTEVKLYYQAVRPAQGW